jgi:membrane associated rhomboid family serine protease
MMQATALVWMMVLLGLVATHWLRRLAPLRSELPGKALATTAALLWVALAGSPLLDRAWPWLALPVGLWVIAPLLIPRLAAAGGWALALGAVNALYWSAAGRDGMRRLLTQTALRQGEGARALALLPSAASESFAAQAHALLGDWAAVLAVPLPPPREAPAGWAARVEALLAVGEGQAAAEMASRLRAELERGGSQPSLYRAVILAEAHIDAEQGNLRRMPVMLESTPVGVPVEVWYALLARAMERLGERERALRLHAEAYRVASPARRRQHAEVLDAAGWPKPRTLQVVGRAPATVALVGFLAAAYLGQTWLDLSLGTLTLGNLRLNASSVASALLLGVPEFPTRDAPWRFLSYAFVHGNLLHVGLNLWVLWDLGRMVEARRGPGYLVAAFTVGAFVGGWLTANQQAGEVLVLVGASGGVLGVAGAWLADLSRRQDASDRAQLRNLVQWLVLMAFISLALPFVSWWGHLGGVLGGALWGFARLGLPAARSVDRIVGGLAALALAWALGQVLVVAAQFL